MKNLICLVLILLSGNAFAANGSGNVSTVAPIGGGGSISGLANSASAAIGSFSTNYYTVSSTGANLGAMTPAHYYSLGKLSGTGAQWKVPSGKIAYCNQQVITCTTANAGFDGQFGYATASFSNDATSVTGGVCYSPNGNCTNSGDGSVHFQEGATAQQSVTYNYFLTFDASATGANADIYPFFRSNGTAAITFAMTCFQQ